ncbi:MAG TPA: spherulation-specific family 4 protein [Polyangiaceae bacterium]|nr:spherulation-specific family 4 protein [Polyangiaceae bacterium]
MVGFVSLTGCAGDSQSEPTISQVAPVSAPQKVAIPSYYWFNATDWNGVTPQNSVGLAMLNPENGRWDASATPGFQSRFAALRALSPRPLIIGYVYTRYANQDPNNQDGGVHDRSVSQVEANIDTYFTTFPELDGIFLDEVTVACDFRLGYYQDIYAWMQVHYPGRKLILNPGGATDQSQCYLSGTASDPRRAGDIIVSFEGSYTTYSQCRTRPAWEMTTQPRLFGT